jgi:DNA-binding PadR family transcriptional regulator
VRAPRSWLGRHKERDELVASVAGGPVDPFQVEQALDRLLKAGAVRMIGQAASGSTPPVTYYGLTADGVEELPYRLRDATMPPSRDWIAYVISTRHEADAIATAGEEALGEYKVAVIPAGTTAEMTAPAVAFYVEARGPQEAIAAASAVLRELRRRAGLGDSTDPVVVAALVPPRRRPAP